MDLPRPPLPAFSVFASTSLIDVFGGQKEASATFDGAALFVDMSGYTPLAESFCRDGADGQEELSEILNQIFSRHVDCIYRAGGEIASFLGDGVLAFWQAGTKSIDDVLALAEQCATDLHQAHRELADISEIAPRLHIGIAAGELWAARLGGIDRLWHQILAGAAAREAFIAGNRAKPGETIIARNQPSKGGHTKVSPGLEDAQQTFAQNHDGGDDQTSDLVPRMVREWWSDDRRQWLPQIRMISALFAKIDKLPTENDDSLQDYQDAVTALQRAIRPYSASSGTLAVDDKGLVFKLYFGMPYNSHRDNDTQALMVGLAIRDALKGSRLAVSVGIANGDGICMPIGGHERMEYTAIGRFAHLAARLMDQPGEAVLCTSDVADRAKNELNLLECAPVTLKGLSEPLAVFRAETAGSPRLSKPSLIGRQSETALIEDCLANLRLGKGGLLHILGDAGIGKTALIDHLLDITEVTNLTTLVGGSTMSEIVLPFHSWRPVFAQLLDLTHPRRSGAVDIEIRLRGLPKDEQHLLPLINAVLPDAIETTSAKIASDVEKLSGEARVDATLGFLARLIRYLAPPGFILVLEDCHWMDQASWQLLERLTATSDDMLVVLTSRPQPDMAYLETLRATPHFQDLKLQPLASDAIKQIIRHATPPIVGEDGDQVWVDQDGLDQAAEFAAGNALFAKEFAYLMAAERKADLFAMTQTSVDLGDVAADLRSKQPKKKSWPRTLQGLIATRLDSLEPPELLALKAASVIGSQFDLALLGHVVPDQPKPKTLLLTITDLLSRHLVLAIDQAAHLYCFQHDLIREVVYGQLTRDQRQRLHNRTAEAIEEVHQDNLTAQFAALADHWSKAEEGPKTLKYAELAAEQALRSGGHEEARRLLQLCFAYADNQRHRPVPMARRLRWYRLSADTQFGLGNLKERRKNADAALRIAGTQRYLVRPRQVVGGLADLAAWSGHRLFGKFRAKPPPGSAELSLEIARIHRHHAAIAWFSSDPIAMTAHSIAALRHAEKGPASEVLAGASAEFGGILGLLGLRKLGRSLMGRALLVADEADERSMLAYVRMLTCLYEVGVGNWTVVEEQALACEKLTDNIGDRVNWSNVQAVRFWSHYYQNDLDAAEELARRLSARLGVDGNDQHRAWAYRFAALCALRRKRPEIARDHLESASTHLMGSTAANDKLPAIGLLALARYRSGERTGAIEAALEGFSMIEDVGRPTGHSMLEGYAALTEVSFHALLEEPASPAWRAAFTQCLQGLDRFQRAFPVGRPRYYIWRGLEQALLGKDVAGRRLLLQAKTQASALGMHWERDLAAMALAVGPEQFLQDLRRHAVSALT